MFYCYTCFSLVGVTQQEIPIIKVSVKIFDASFVCIQCILKVFVSRLAENAKVIIFHKVHFCNCLQVIILV